MALHPLDFIFLASTSAFMIVVEIACTHDRLNMSTDGLCLAVRTPGNDGTAGVSTLVAPVAYHAGNRECRHELMRRRWLSHSLLACQMSLALTCIIRE